MSSRDDSNSDSAADSAVLAQDSCWDPTRSDQPGRRIVTTVGDLEDCEPTALPPLFEAVDPDALNALFSTTGAGGGVELVRLRYCGYTIIISRSTLTVLESE